MCEKKELLPLEEEAIDQQKTLQNLITVVKYPCWKFSLTLIMPMYMYGFDIARSKDQVSKRKWEET